jgi:hypothetical protein
MAKQQRTDNEVWVRQMTREEEHELAEELYRLRDDPEEWEDEPTEFIVDPNFGIVYSVRFTREEFRQIEEIAARKSLTIGELIKSTLLDPETPEKPTAARPKRSRRTVGT